MFETIVMFKLHNKSNRWSFSISGKKLNEKLLINPFYRVLTGGEYSFYTAAYKLQANWYFFSPLGMLAERAICFTSSVRCL